MKQRKELHELMSKYNHRPFWYPAASKCLTDTRSYPSEGEGLSLGVDHPNWHLFRVKDKFNIVEARNLVVHYNPKAAHLIERQKGVEYYQGPSAEKVGIAGPGIMGVYHSHYLNHPVKTLMLYDGLKKFTDHTVTRKSDNDLYLNGKKIAGNAVRFYAGTTLCLESGFLNAEINPAWEMLLPKRYRQPMTGILNEDPEFDIVGYFEWLYKNARYYR